MCGFLLHHVDHILDKKQSADARASSFLTILDIIPQLVLPPVMIFVENVVGFEAKRKPSSFINPEFNGQLIRVPEPLFDSKTSTSNEMLQTYLPIERFLEFRNSTKNTYSDEGSLDQYFVPSSLSERWGSAMDIVYPDSKRCCCFTKSYYRYVKGTGSLLATVMPTIRDKTSLEDLRLRYFTPREVSNLHSFPKEFEFPEHVTLRQRYALLGNSLSVAVVAPLLRYLFSDP